MQSFKSGFLTALAVVTCPCHLPLLLTLAVGTSAGALLARYQGPVFGVMLVVSRFPSATTTAEPAPGVM